MALSRQFNSEQKSDRSSAHHNVVILQRRDDLFYINDHKSPIALLETPKVQGVIVICTNDQRARRTSASRHMNFWDGSGADAP